MKAIAYSVFFSALWLTACGGGGDDDDADAGTPPTVSAVCFDNLLDPAGVSYELNYAGSDASGPYTTRTTGGVAGGAAFNGFTGLNKRTETTSFVRTNAPSTNTSSTATYFQPRANQLPVVYGSQTLLRTFQSTIKYEPPFEDNRAALQAGQTAAYAAKGQQQSGMDDAAPWTVFEQTTQVTFVGTERIQTPAGEYQACRYDTHASGSTSSTWVLRGVVIKSVAGNQTQTLTSLHVNGTPIQSLQ